MSSTLVQQKPCVVFYCRGHYDHACSVIVCALFRVEVLVSITMDYINWLNKHYTVMSPNDSESVVSKCKVRFW